MQTAFARLDQFKDEQAHRQLASDALARMAGILRIVLLDAFRGRRLQLRQFCLFLCKKTFDVTPHRVITFARQPRAEMLDVELRDEDTLIHGAPSTSKTVSYS